MKRPIHINVTTHALRCIDRVGGIDNYLLKTPERDLTSLAGVKLKRLLEKRLKHCDRIAKRDGKSAEEVLAAAPMYPTNKRRVEKEELR